MFLDDELYEIGSKFNGSNDIELIKEMIQKCFDKTSIDIRKDPNDETLVTTFKRVNNSWNIAIDKLAKDNNKITIKDGFLLFMLYSDKFKAVHNIINTILKTKTK